MPFVIGQASRLGKRAGGFIRHRLCSPPVCAASYGASHGPSPRGKPAGRT